MQVVGVVVKASVDVVQWQSINQSEVSAKHIVYCVLIFDSTQSFQHSRFLLHRERAKLNA